MDDGVARFFTRFGGNLLTCGRRSRVSETQNETVVSWKYSVRDDESILT